VPEHKDCIQWVMESSPRSKPWTADRIVHELMALWFGAVHIVTTNICSAVHDICLHPEYLAPLRKELDSCAWEHFEQTGKGLPLLDSFLKESGRTTPTESMNSRRMALEPFKLSDGTQLNIGIGLLHRCAPCRETSAFFQMPPSSTLSAMSRLRVCSNWSKGCTSSSTLASQASSLAQATRRCGVRDAWRVLDGSMQRLS
jgi:hypothetical protein